MATNYILGPFRLDAEAEILFRGAEPMTLGRRAIAVLRVLVERPGIPVSKDTLIEAAWAGLSVEENNPRHCRAFAPYLSSHATPVSPTKAAPWM
jgi:DNA-binding winged helix-turn-helix (wHTH) protein